jgi:hypothetical protein
MAEWGSPRLESLAPLIDERAALALFRRRRARKRLRQRAGLSVLAAGLVVAAVVASMALMHRDHPQARVAAVGDDNPTTTVAQPSDVAQARADVVAAIEHAHNGSLTIEQRDTAVDDPSGLAAIAHEISDQYGAAAALVRADNIHVVFTSPTRADVHFSIVSNSGAFPIDGGAVLTSSGWKMTRATRCLEFAPARKSCP